MIMIAYYDYCMRDTDDFNCDVKKVQQLQSNAKTSCR